MHRNDDSKYFLYIEPSLEEKSTEGIDDVYTEAVQYFLDRAKEGAASYSNLKDNGTFDEGNGWRGIHGNCDGEMSTSRDYLLENGYITNALCVHYVRWFRSAIDGPNLEKLETLKELFENRTL